MWSGTWGEVQAVGMDKKSRVSRLERKTGQQRQSGDNRTARDVSSFTTNILWRTLSLLFLSPDQKFKLIESQKIGICALIITSNCLPLSNLFFSKESESTAPVFVLRSTPTLHLHVTVQLFTKYVFTPIPMSSGARRMKKRRNLTKNKNL